MAPRSAGDTSSSALTHEAGSSSEPSESRVASFEATTDRIRQLKDELEPLIERQRGHMWEMKGWGWSQRRIAAICGVSQVQVLHVLKGQR